MVAKFRFGVMAAVSSSDQASEDKGSLEDQEDFARKAGIAQGGVETAGPYVLDGYSRSGYVDLSKALKDIPPLAEAIENLEQNKYDVLIVDNLERLGNLAPMLFTLFGQKKKQIHSARQSGRIHPPEEYNPSADESANIMMHVEGLIQGYRINKLQRGLDVGIRKRIEQGKYSHSFPYGYIKTADGFLELDAPVAQLLIQLKDKFFEGLSLRDLAKIATASSVPSPNGLSHWDFMTVRGLLTNPFFAGKVFRNRWRVTGKKFGPTGKPYHVMRENLGAILYDGKHRALWTWDEYKRILVELDERYRKNSRHHPRVFTGLLICSVCGKRLTFKQGKYKCRPLPDHIRLPEAEAEWAIGEALVVALRDYDEAPPQPPSLDVKQRAIDELERRIIKAQRMTEKEIYTEEQGQERVRELRARIATTEASHEQHEREVLAHARLLEIRAGMLDTLDTIPLDLLTGEKKKSNRFLRDILEYIEVTPEHVYKFKFR